MRAIDRKRHYRSMALALKRRHGREHPAYLQMVERYLAARCEFEHERRQLEMLLRYLEIQREASKERTRLMESLDQALLMLSAFLALLFLVALAIIGVMR